MEKPTSPGVLRKIIAVGLFWTLALPPLAEASPSPATQTWYLLKVHQRPVGYVHIRQTQAASHQWITEVQSLNRLQRQGKPFDSGWQSRFVEDIQTGAAVAFRHQIRLANALPTQTDATLNDIKPNPKSRFLFPVGHAIARMYQQHFQDPTGSTFEFQTINLADQPELVQAHVSVGRPEILHIPGMGRQIARRFDLDNHVSEWRDAKGTLLKAICDAMGTEMIYASERTATHITALDAITETQIPSTPIHYPRQLSEGLFKISTSRMADPAILNLFDNDDRYQVVEKTTLPEGGKDIFLRVKNPDPFLSNREYPISDAAENLASTDLINSDDSAIVLQAKTLTKSEPRAFLAAQILRRWVYQNIHTKTLNVGFASASETIANREGDCTEHAVLFAAMTRAIKIPSRIAVGLVYLPQPRQEMGMFGFHMWTEVNIGTDGKGNPQWVPMDASFAEDRQDATHLKIAETPLQRATDLRALAEKVTTLAGQLNIEVVSAQSLPEGVFDLSTQAKVNPIELPKFDLSSIDLKALNRANIMNASITPPPSGLSLDTSEGQYVLGLQKLTEDDYAAAMTAFNAALEMTTNPYRLAQQFLAAEVYGMADRAFQKAGKTDAKLLPNTRLTADDEALYFSAMNAQHDENWETATQGFQTVRSHQPNFAPVYFHLGEVAVNQSQYSEATTLFRRGLALQPNNPRGQAGLALSLKGEKQFAQASQVYQQAGLTADSKIAAAQAILVRQPNSVSALVQLGQGYLEKHQSGVARQAFQKAIYLNSKNEQAVRGLFQIVLDQADWLTLKQLYPKASAVSQTADILALRARYQMRLREYKTAAQLARQAIGVNPAAIFPYEIYAQIQQRQNLSPVLILETGIRRTQSDQLKLTLAKAVLTSQPARALQLTSELMRKQSKPTPVLLATHALALTHTGNFQEANRVLKEALVSQPDVPELLMAKGELASAEDFSGQAVIYYQKVLTLLPGDAKATNALRDVITEHQLGLKKPPLCWVLTDDEVDYLIQREISKKEEAALDRQARGDISANTAHQGKMSVAAINERKAMVPLLENYMHDMTRFYERQNAMVPPARFAALHSADLQALYARIEMLYGQADSLPPILATKGQKPTAEQTRDQTRVGKTIQAVKAAELRYMLYVAPPDQQRIQAESNLPSLSE